jgi:dTDP-4-dehydrorhamnose reductase
MKVMLFGSNGQVGSAILDVLLRNWDIVALSRRDADLARPGAVAAAIGQHQPDVVINAAAWTAVDRAEHDPDLVRRINADAVAEMADAIGSAWLITFSSDYVFDGTKDGPYRETDQPNPLSIYGESKYLGELALAKSGVRHLILRTSWVHSATHPNFVNTILRLAKEREQLSIVDDQIGAPTSAALIARVTLAAALRIAAGNPLPTGLYHLAASGHASWHHYARFARHAVASTSCCQFRRSSTSRMPSGLPIPSLIRASCRQRWASSFPIGKTASGVR